MATITEQTEGTHVAEEEHGLHPLLLAALMRRHDDEDEDSVVEHPLLLAADPGQHPARTTWPRSPTAVAQVELPP